MNIVSMTLSELPVSQAATYSCTLTNMWNETRHPFLYDTIADSAHWSPPVLATHNSNYQMWLPNTMASEGVERVAETGRTSVLETELEAEQTIGTVGEIVIGQDQFNSADPPQTFDDITLTPDFPLLSTISMMAPSPDWFSGIFDVNPAVDGVWLEEFSISTYPFDAGTEMGTTYSITNPASTPRSVIYPLVASTVPQNGILLDPTGTKVLPVAMWSCTLKTLSEPTATTPAPAPEPSESPAAQPECFEYSQTCTVNADCCSQRCRSGVCRLSTALTTYRDGFRISIQDGGTNIGGAAGRDRSNGSGGGLLRGRV